MVVEYVSFSLFIFVFDVGLLSSGDCYFFCLFLFDILFYIIFIFWSILSCFLFFVLFSISSPINIFFSAPSYSPYSCLSCSCLLLILTHSSSLC